MAKAKEEGKAGGGDRLEDIKKPEENWWEDKSVDMNRHFGWQRRNEVSE